MKPTKLEDYLTIIQILTMNQRPLEFAEIESAVRTKGAQLEKDLAFLAEQNAIQRKFSGSSEVFSAAPLGGKLVRYFRKETPLNREL